MSALYLYGITEEGDIPAIPLTQAQGVGPVYAIGHDGIAAVVSDYAGLELGALPKEELVQLVLGHQLVIEQVMPGRTVLPAKVGTVLAGAEEARGLLSQGYSDLTGALEASRGRLEIEVAATWDTQRVLHAIANEEEIVQAREAIAASDRPNVQEKVRLGQMVKDRLDRRREGYRDRITGFLESFSVDVAPNALMSDEMVMNVAFLVDQDRRQKFEDGVGRLDQLFHGEIDFRIIGPLPPYSFSTVEVSILKSGQVEAARQSLQVGEMFSERDVRRSYRRLAAQEQRSILRGDEAAAVKRFLELRRASELLLAHLGSAQRTADLDGGPTFLIKIRRSAVEEPAHAPLPDALGRPAHV